MSCSADRSFGDLLVVDLDTHPVGANVLGIRLVLLLVDPDEAEDHVLLLDDVLCTFLTETDDVVHVHGTNVQQ